MIWSFVLAGIGVFGLYLAGRGNSTGWVVGICAQVLWAIYAVTTDQWGFLVSCVAYAWVYAMPLYRTRRDEREWTRRYLEQLVRVPEACAGRCQYAEDLGAPEWASCADETGCRVAAGWYI